MKHLPQAPQSDGLTRFAQRLTPSRDDRGLAENAGGLTLSKPAGIPEGRMIGPTTRTQTHA